MMGEETWLVALVRPNIITEQRLDYYLEEQTIKIKDKERVFRIGFVSFWKRWQYGSR